MEQQAYKLSTAISGGQQQSVAIARSLANDPPLIMVDESTGNLDSKTAADVFGLFAGLVAAGKTIVMVTHDADFAARMHWAVRIADGSIINDAVAARENLSIAYLSDIENNRRYPINSKIELLSKTPKTLNRHRKKAMDQLATMFALL
jgi:ABC-type polar amino acid transport system ATPase subunit